MISFFVTIGPTVSGYPLKDIFIPFRRASRCFSLNMFGFFGKFHSIMNAQGAAETVT